MKPKMTVWHEGTEKPVRDGVYQRKFSNGVILYCRYSKNKWYWGWGDISSAAQDKWISGIRNTPWRGITNPTKN